MAQIIGIGLSSIKEIAKAKKVTPQTIWKWQKKDLLEVNGIVKAGKNFYLSLTSSTSTKLITAIYTPREFSIQTKTPEATIYRDLQKGKDYFMKKYPAILIKLGSGKAARYAIITYSFGNKMICPYNLIKIR